jgi:hypothetical protein
MECGEWRAVPGFSADELLVSSGGWVKTKWRGGFALADGTRELGCPTMGSMFQGHRVVNLHNKRYQIRWLVLQTFVGPAPSAAHVVEHRDGNVLNVALENLYWAFPFQTEEYGEWRAVPGIAPDKLLVSSKGWIRTARRGGKLPVGGEQRPLGMPSKGQPLVSHAMGFNVDKKAYLVHRMVALAFIGPQPSPRHTVDHIDRDPKNNAVENLRWASHEEQQRNKDSCGPRRDTTACESQDNIVVDGEVEVWKLSPISSALRVSTMGRIQRRRGSRWQAKWTPKRTKRCPYAYTGLADGKKIIMQRLVLLTFQGPSSDPEKSTADHINCVRDDNRLRNLQWATKSEQGFNTVRKQQ